MNNFERPAASLAECRRVARAGAEIALATNLQGTFAGGSTSARRGTGGIALTVPIACVLGRAG